jgi:hypothetical protein
LTPGKKRIEKWCLRAAFDTPENPFLPDEVRVRFWSNVCIHVLSYDIQTIATIAISFWIA